MDDQKTGGTPVAPSDKKPRMKVSEKGALSVYGLGRFPVTLYKEQWQRLLAMSDEIRAFLKENDAALKSKGETPRGEAKSEEVPTTT